MPNYDAGHYFLTVLAPVRLDSFLLPNGQSQSRRHAIREALTLLAPAATSPFARNTRNHFARMFVLDDTVFNGRNPGNALLGSLPGQNPLLAQKVDRLTNPYLIFTADFDAVSDAPDQLDSYLTTLWTTMPDELNAVFRHCVGFDSVTSAPGFCAYIRSCQIETTMPFNDYWPVMPDLSGLNWKPYAGALAAILLLTILFGHHWLALIGFAITGCLFGRAFLERAKTPFPASPPPAPGTDLPTVLKALTVQRAYTDFALEHQGATPEALYDAFGAFKNAIALHDLAAPTQPPGVIGV